jgi:hypothetical protein
MQRPVFQRRDLPWGGENGNRLSPKAFASFVDSCYQKEWVVYSKEPFNGAEGVFEYLGRYTHRLVISNNRIVSVEDGRTTFLWKDYKDESRMKETTLSNEEFIRRFLLHVLPHGYIRIRRYGLYSSRSKTSRLELYRMALAISSSSSRRRRKPCKKERRQLETPSRSSSEFWDATPGPVQSAGTC